jgi:Arc/MetJ-type ribon-helix-helix transcriptional regulator
MTVQVAVKLPDELAAAIDELVREGSFASRSQALRAGAEAVVAAGGERAAARRYRQAFAREPETPHELAAAARLAIEAIDAEPWERWW